MSEHAWVQENLAAYVAGGLDAVEAERVEAHAAECENCTAALHDARALDHGMDALFAAVRPEPALEDRMIQALRTAPRRVRSWPRWNRKLVWGAAATVALGATGAAVSQLGLQYAPSFPGTSLPEMVVAQTETRDPSNRNYTEPASERGAMGITDVNHDGALDRFPFIEQDNIYSYAAKNESALKGNGTASTFYQNGERIQNGTSNSILPHSVFGYLGGGGAGGNSGNIQGKPFVPEDSKRRNPAGGLGMTGVITFGPPPARIMGGQETSALDRAVAPQGAADPGVSGKGSGKSGDAPTSGGYGWGKGKSSEEEGEKKHKETNGQAVTTADNFVPDQHRAKAEFKPDLADIPILGRENGGQDKSKSAGDQQEQQKAGGAEGKDDKGLPPGPIKTTRGKSESEVTMKPPQPTAEQAPTRKVIRSGDIEFEVLSFDSAAAGVTKLVTAIKGAFVATVNSDKLPNGKVKGSIVVRVPPDALDGLVLDLRRELGKDGELKGLRIASQDVTKQYTDLQSRLTAARTMEERLLKIIKEGKGEIKQLLEAERELGVWRTKIEEFEGEIRYYNNLTSLSTLTITLAEKSITSAVDIVEREQVETGVEVEDVDKAREETLAAVTEAKGRVIKAEMKQFAAGQYNATLNFEVPADKAGPLRDRLRQIGNMVRLEINRTQQAEGGTPTRDAKVRRGDTIFAVSLYNVTAMGVRETTKMGIAAPDVPAAYRTLREAIGKLRGSRIIKAELNEQDRTNVSAELQFDVRRADVEAAQTALAAAGDITSRNVSRVPVGDDPTKVTDAKVRFEVKLFDAIRIEPRERVGLVIEVSDVDSTTAVFAAQVKEMGGRVLGSQSKQEATGRTGAVLVYDVPLASAPALVEQLKKAGTVRAQEATRNPQAPEGKLAIARINVWLSNAELIVPKDDGLWAQVRTGLGTSVRFLLVSLSWIIFGLLVVLPWAVVGYGAYRLVRRLFRATTASTAAPATPAA